MGWKRMTTESTMTDDQRLKILNDAGGFNAQNGIMLTEWDDGFGALRVDLAAGHLNPMRLVHGGLYTSMLDVALANMEFIVRKETIFPI